MSTIRLKQSDFAKVISFDAQTRTNRRTRRFNYLVPARNGGVKIFTVAVRRTKDERTEAKVIATHDPRRKRIFLRDVVFSGIPGWITVWEKNVSAGTIDWTFDCGAAFSYEPIVNPEALSETKYAHCGWVAGRIGLADYLHLYEADSRVEYVAKAGLWKLVTPGGIKRLGESREFFEFCREHAAEIKSGEFGIREILSAMRRKVSLARAKAHAEAVNVFASCGGIPKATREHAEKLLAWSERLREADGIRLDEYVRYLCLADRCGRDLSDEKNLFPPAARFPEILERVEAEADKLDKRLKLRDYRTGMKRARERFGHITGMRAGTLSAEIPFSKKELRAEGRAMKNCVGRFGYDSKIARGASLVVFIRRSGEPDADMEIHLGAQPRIAQLYSAGNGKPTEDVEAFSRKILRRVKEAYCADREGSVKRG